MTFTVTYRGANGAPVTETVEAADRADCLAQLKTRGIAATGVKESAAKRDGRDDGNRRNKRDWGNPAGRMNIACVLLIALTLLAGGLWWFGRDEAPPPQDDGPARRKTALAKEVTPAKAPKPVELPAGPTNKVETVVLPDGTVTNKPKTIAEAVAMVRLKPGFHRYDSVDEVFAKTNDFQIGDYKKPLFGTQTERQLGLVATMPRDRMIPPMPPLSFDMERDFEKALSAVIEIGDNDSEADARTKARVAHMKELMRELVKGGGMTVSQAFREIEREHNRLANMTMLYKGEYRRLVLKGDASAAEFLKEANKELRRAGACEFDENANSINP